LALGIFKPWVRLAILVTVAVVTVLAISLLAVHLNYPVLPLWALPPGVPRWWGIMCATSLAIVIVLVGIASGDAVAVVQNLTSVQMTIQRWWNRVAIRESAGYSLSTKKTLLRVCLVFLVMPLIFWILLGYSIVVHCGVSLDPHNCWVLSITLVAVGTGNVLILQHEIASRVGDEHGSKPLRKLLTTLGGGGGALLLAPLALIVVALTPLLAIIGGWLRRPNRSER